MIDQELKEKYKKLNKEELNEQFIAACDQGQLEVVKYLLTSVELKKHADIHAKDDWGFRGACRDGRLEVIKYLIIDMNIDKTNYIETYLNKNIKDNKEKVKKMKI